MSTATHNRSVLILCKHYLPGFKAGGPIKSVANLCATLGNSLDVRVFTLNCDAESTEPYKETVFNQWYRRALEWVYYSENDRLLALRLLWNLIKHRNSIVYLNSLFDPLFSTLPIVVLSCLGRRANIRIAPRGELSAGALSLKSGKKKLFLQLSRAMGLHRGLVWHATANEEANDIKNWYPDFRQLFVLENIPNRPMAIESVGTKAKVVGCLDMIFLSRITPKKNLLGALRVVSKIPDISLKLDIVGPIRDSSYWAECQLLIADMPLNVSVRYLGELEPRHIPKLLLQYDALFLPTLNENYGHVIVEALASGCPVLISDRTPWNHVVQQGCGWVCAPDNIDAFRHVIFTLAEEDNVDWNIHRVRAIGLVEQLIGKDFARDYLQLFA